MSQQDHRRSVRPYTGLLVSVCIALSATATMKLYGQGGASSTARTTGRGEQFLPVGNIDPEGEAVTSGATEAPAAFDDTTNGFDPQGPPMDSLDEDNVVALRSFNDNKFIFEEVESIGDGLGPTYNAQSCRECHQNI